MRLAKVSAHSLLGSLLLVVVAACSEKAAKPLVSEPQPLEPSLDLVWSKCPDPYLSCQLFHGPYSVPTNGIEGTALFEMNYGAEMRVVAADDQGDFPRTFFVWHDGTIQPHGEGLGSCLLTNTENKNVTKTRMDIPETKSRCADDLTVGEHLYHEHFASNPVTGCLGWIECTEVVP